MSAPAALSFRGLSVLEFLSSLVVKGTFVVASALHASFVFALLSGLSYCCFPCVAGGSCAESQRSAKLLMSRLASVAVLGGWLGMQVSGHR